MWRSLGAIVVAAAVAVPALAQTPQPFPRPGGTQTQPARPAAPAPQQPRTAPAAPTTPPAPTSTAPSQERGAPTGAPDAAALGGFPLYPTAKYLASYDAGRGQRYYIFGSTAPYSDLVAYYRAQLKQKGDEVFDQPATYMFQVGRFREETMAFPPGVTVKDWTWGGSKGYPNPTLGAQPERFPTIIMIVPPPPAAAPQR